MTEAEALQIFHRIRWPHTAGRPVCPWCKSKHIYHLTDRRYRCADCYRDFSVTTGTPFSHLKKPISYYVRALRMFQVNMTPLLAARLLEVDYRTAWSWKQYIVAMKLVASKIGENGINKLYELRELSSHRLIVQSSNLEAAIREARWHHGIFRADGTSAKFYIHEITRKGWHGLRGRSCRFGRRWPSAKLTEFREDWLGGMRLVDLENKYDCSPPTIAKAIKRLREAFDPKDDAPMLYMLNDGMTINEISEHFQCAPDSLVRRLNYICPEETRSRLDRAKHEWRESIRADRREAKRARKEADHASMAIAANAAGDCPENRFNDLGIPPSVLAAINKKYARWNEIRSSLALRNAILRDLGVRPSVDRGRLSSLLLPRSD